MAKQSSALTDISERLNSFCGERTEGICASKLIRSVRNAARFRATMMSTRHLLKDKPFNARVRQIISATEALGTPIFSPRLHSDHAHRAYRKNAAGKGLIGKNYDASGLIVVFLTAALVSAQRHRLDLQWAGLWVTLIEKQLKMFLDDWAPSPRALVRREDCI